MPYRISEGNSSNDPFFCETFTWHFRMKALHISRKAKSLTKNKGSSMGKNGDIAGI